MSTNEAAELTAAIPAAWGINADGTTGPDPGPRMPPCCPRRPGSRRSPASA